MSAYNLKLSVELPDGLSRNAGEVSLAQMLGVVIDPAWALCEPEKAREEDGANFCPVQPCSEPSKPKLWVAKTGGLVSEPRLAWMTDGAALEPEVAVSVNCRPADVAPPRLKRNWQKAEAPPARLLTEQAGAGEKVTPGCVVVTVEVTGPEASDPVLRIWYRAVITSQLSAMPSPSPEDDTTWRVAGTTWTKAPGVTAQPTVASICLLYTSPSPR